MGNELKLFSMSEVAAQDVRWLWYPYIPCGKITIMQGDPGEGKTMLSLTLAALLSRGLPLPGQEAQPPMSIIFQTAEDGLADTVKPRLERAGADCSRIIVIDDSDTPLTILDERLEQAIIKERVQLLILDPLQAFLGAEVDMHRANEVRPAFRRLAAVAERTGCAVVIVGHMNKMQGAKGIYRGLGSIDISAIARSILFVGRSKENPDLRCMAQLKNSLAPFGETLLFDIGERITFCGVSDITADKLLSETGTAFAPTKTESAIEELQRILSEGELPASEILAYFEEMGVGEKTVKNAKKELGVLSVKRGSQWMWTLEKEGRR